VRVNEQFDDPAVTGIVTEPAEDGVPLAVNVTVSAPVA